jgi:hypothetical protein
VESLDDEVTAADEDGDTHEKRNNEHRHIFLLFVLFGK